MRTICESVQDIQIVCDKKDERLADVADGAKLVVDKGGKLSFSGADHDNEHFEISPKLKLGAILEFERSSMTQEQLLKAFSKRTGLEIVTGQEEPPADAVASPPNPSDED